MIVSKCRRMTCYRLTKRSSKWDIINNRPYDSDATIPLSLDFFKRNEDVKIKYSLSIIIWLGTVTTCFEAFLSPCFYQCLHPWNYTTPIEVPPSSNQKTNPATTNGVMPCIVRYIPYEHRFALPKLYDHSIFFGDMGHNIIHDHCVCGRTTTLFIRSSFTPKTHFV